MRKGAHGLRRWREVFVGQASGSFQGELFEQAKPGEAVAVKLDGVRLERSRSFGAVWLGWLLWQALKFDELLSELLPRGRESVSWADVVAHFGDRRGCASPPVSYMWPSGGIAPRRWKICWGCQAKTSTTSVCTARLDRVLPHKEAIEKHLVKRLGELFELDYDLLLYDVTSTYFEGVADPDIAERGYSRDHRPDCVQINIALVVTREGMPLGYEIFRWQHHRCHHGQADRRDDGGAIRQSEPGLGDGPRHGER